MRAIVALRIAAVLVLGAAPAASQIVMHEERDWGCPTPCIPAGFPFPMGDYDEQALFTGIPPSLLAGYAGPFGCPLAPPPLASPFGFPGATLWHTEVDCCAAGVAPTAPIAGCFAAYNHGPAGGPFGEPPFTYLTFAAAGGATVRNTGAISSYGIGGVPVRPPTPTGAGGQEIILCFDYVKVTEGGGVAAFDTCFVEIRGSICGEPAPLDPAGAPPWTSIAVLAGNNLCPSPLTCCIGPGHPALDATFITPPAAPLGGKIRFRFDTRDGINNGTCGWNVDNVVLTNEECVPCAAAGGGSIVSSGGEPVPGNACFALNLDAGPPFGFTFLVIGIANMPPPPGGCGLCCAPSIILGPFPTDAFGDFTLPLPIPAGFPACGPSFCLQWVTLAPVPPGIFPSTAGKLRMQIG